MTGPPRKAAAGAATLLLLACLAPAPAVSPPLQRERHLAARVSRDRALDRVRRLVAEGPRMGGTASGDRAARLLTSWLEEAGLHVEVVEDPPRRVHEESSWTVEMAGTALASAWPYGFSPSLSRGDYPLLLDDALARGGSGPDGAPAGGAVLTSRAAHEVLPRAVAARAAALLTDHPADPNRFTGWAPILEIPASQRSPGGEGLLPVFGLSYGDGRALRTALAGGRPVRLTLSLASRVGEGRPRTVVATLPGAGARGQEIILVCAHGDSDSGGPGAEDNASGEAALLEVAGALAAAAAAGELPADRPQVRFAIWGAELHSSAAYIRSRAAEMPRHVAVFNYDQAGFGSTRDALYYEGNDVPWNAPLLRLIEAVARDHAGQQGFWTEHTSNPTLGGTDMYEFLPARHKGSGATDARIPVTTVFTAAWDRPTLVTQTPGWESPGWPDKGDLFIDHSAYYHSSGDRPENTTDLEPWNIERCARLVLLAISRLMQEGKPTAREAGPSPG